jgi:hypothetical protein
MPSSVQLPFSNVLKSEYVNIAVELVTLNEEDEYVTSSNFVFDSISGGFE